MKFLHSAVALATILQTTNAVSPPSEDVARSVQIKPDAPFVERAPVQELWKRKGGGGKGGSSGPKGGSSGSGSSGTGSGPKGSSTSNAGGLTTVGSGPRPAYGAGGVYYGGGAKIPYSPGGTSPSGIVPGFALGGVAFLGGAYLYGAYTYPYTHHYYYHNATTNKNETKPVECVCSAYETCGCDDNGDDTYFKSVIGDGSYQNLNHSLVTVVDGNITEEARADNSTNSTILILGSLPNGTTAPGGDEDPNAAGAMMSLLQAAGWWPAITTVLALTLFA